MKYALIRHNIEYSKSKEWFNCSWSVNGLDMLETQANFALNWWRENEYC